MVVRGITSLSSPSELHIEPSADESGAIVAPDAAGSAPGVGDVFGNLVVQAATATRDAATQADLLARGAHDDIHGTMIAAKEAEISVKLVGTIRNKLIDAFQELWRTNV